MSTRSGIWDLGSGPLSGKQTACEAWGLFTVSAAQQLRTQPTDARNPLPASVGSGTGRPAAFRPWVFLSPPAEPGVPVFEHRALHVPCRWSAGGCRCRGPRGRDGAAAIAVASHLDAGCAGKHHALGGDPPAAVAEPAPQLLPADPVLAAQPFRQSPPRMLIDVAEGILGHRVPKVGLWGAETWIRAVSRRSVPSLDGLHALVDRSPAHTPWVPEVVVSCCDLVLMDQSTQDVAAAQLTNGHGTHRISTQRRHRRRLGQAAVRDGAGCHARRSVAGRQQAAGDRRAAAGPGTPGRLSRPSTRRMRSRWAPAPACRPPRPQSSATRHPTPW